MNDTKNALENKEFISLISLFIRYIEFIITVI